ncbi:MAG: hypothetical protein IIA05_12885 [Proteobacteria bacterium]|nr:hypothetical protein [Pseudomonadota bacterium]
MKLGQDLRRRHIFRLVGLYVFGAWVVIEVASVFFPAWGIPDTALRYLIIAAVLGFPIAMVFGWFFDITASGIVRTAPAGEEELADFKLKRLDYLILVALLAVSVAVLFGSFEKIMETTDELSQAIPLIDKPANSIAVLPFVSLDDETETEYFSNGVTEEILHRLSTFDALKVIGRTSSFAFGNSDMGVPRISNILGVRYLLQGSVRRESNVVRVTAQLVDESGFQLWSETFDRKLEGIFAIQTEIANRVASELVNEIVASGAQSIASTTTNMVAYNAYLLGRAFLNRRTPGWQQHAAAEFRSAIDLDPDYAPPYAGLAIATMMGGSGEGFVEAQAQAQEAIGHALGLDPELAEAHAAQGLLLLKKRDPNPAAAEAALRRALLSDPNLVDAHNWLANALGVQGRRDESHAAMERGLKIDPLNPVILLNVANRYQWNGDFRRTEQLLLRLMDLPEPPGIAYWGLHNLYERYGRYVDVHQWAKKIILAYGESDRIRGFSVLSTVYGRLGMSEDADYWVGLDPNKFSRFVRKGYLFKLRGDRTGLKIHLENFMRGNAVDYKMLPAVPAKLLGVINLEAGNYEKGVEILTDVFDLESPVALGSLLAIDILQMRAFAHRQVGDEASAVRVLRRVDQELQNLADSEQVYNPSVLELIALNQAMHGDVAGALESLESAVSLGWQNYYAIVNDQRWAEVLREPEFVSLLSWVKAGLDRQRSKVETIDAEEDFRAVVERLFPEESLASTSAVR